MSGHSGSSSGQQVLSIESDQVRIPSARLAHEMGSAHGAAHPDDEGRPVSRGHGLSLPKSLVLAVELPRQNLGALNLKGTRSLH